MPRRVAELSADRCLQAYVIGVAIGDGNLSDPNGRAVRLRITRDAKYPRLIAKIRDALVRQFPDNRVNVVGSRGNYVNLSVYSNRLAQFLGWNARDGSKQLQDIRVPAWIVAERPLSICCLQGLIETDGAVYKDRGYPMVIFSTVIGGLARQVCSMMQSLSFRPRIYEVPKAAGRASVKYQVRLSRDVPAFLDLVQPLKR